MMIEKLLGANGLFFEEDIFLKTLRVKDSHYGVSDEILAMVPKNETVVPKNETVLIIGRNHSWTVHMGNLGEKEKKILLVRMMPSRQHEVTIQMETLARDYGCSYEFDGKKEVIGKATYEEDKAKAEEEAKLEEDIERSNGKIGEFKSWAWMVFGIAAAYLGAFLIASMNATAIAFGIIAMVAGICEMVVWGVKLSRANAEDARCDAALAAEKQKRGELTEKRDVLLKKREEEKSQGQ